MSMLEYLDSLRGLWLLPALLFMYWEWEIIQSSENAEERTYNIWNAALVLVLIISLRFLP